jgi:hypothetical protein
MIQSMEKIVGDTTYIITQFPARKALNLKIRLAKIIAKGLGKDLDLSTLEDAAVAGNMEAAGNATISALAGIIAELDEAAANSIINELISQVKIRTNAEILDVSAIFDSHFAGKMLDIYKLLYAVLEVNYPDFFGAGSVLGRAITGAKAKISVPEPTQA